jgi:diacylglycerol O-acyltransferase / wax synthase
MGEATLLGGADVFHLVHDRAMRREGLAGNQCVLVPELGRTAARAEALVPHLRVRLEAGLLRHPRWVQGPPLGAARVRVVPSNGDSIAAASSLFAERATRDDRPWEIVIFRGPRRDAVLIPWFHPYTDARGIERFARWIGGARSSADLSAPPPSEELLRARPRGLEGLDLRARMNLARAYNTHILGFARAPILSLRGASPGRSLGAMRFSRLRLSPGESADLDRRIRARARLAESSVMLFSAVRMVDAALRRRGFAPAQHLVPVPLSLDPKVGSSRMFGNHLTMMMFSLRRDDLAEERRALATLAEQQRAIVRDKLDLAMAAALELVAKLPSPAYLGLATLPFHGELSSLILSNPGAVAIDAFAGLPVLDAFPVPAVVPRPGVEVIFSRHGGQLSAILGTFDGLVQPGEPSVMLDSLRADLFGEGGDPPRPVV